MDSGDPLQEFAERLASVFTAAGFPRMAARVLMTLVMATDAGLTAAQLCERLGVSAAAVSGAVKYLEALGMIRRLPQPGSRKELYELPATAWYTASLRSTPVYDAISAILPEGVAVARAADSAPALARLTEMEDFFRFIRTRLPQLLVEWNASRAERGDQTDASPGVTGVV